MKRINLGALTLLTLAGITLSGCSPEPPFEEGQVDRAELALRVEGIGIEREELLEVGESLCIGEESDVFDNIMDTWTYKDKRFLVESTAEHMCDKDLANPVPKEDQEESLWDRAYRAHGKIRSGLLSSADRNQIEYYSHGVCEAYGNGLETRYRVYALQGGQNDAIKEEGRSDIAKWSYGDAILIDRAIVEEVCDA